MNRYLATSLVATATAAGAFLVFVAHGCALNPFADYSYEEAQKELAGPSSSATGTGSTGGFGGAGGAAGAGGTGGVMPCICVDDQNLCTDDVVGECPDGVDEKSCHKAIANIANSACTQANGDPGFCDAAGICKSCQECADAACMKRCNGQVCLTGTVCESGNCVDGFCCNSACTGPCYACNRVPGMCSQLPFGMVDECGMGQLCGDTGVCVPAAGAVLGALCTKGTDCASGVCQAQICVSMNGQPCVEDLECSSNLCDPVKHTCISCASGVVTCPMGATCLPSGQCQVFPGQPSQMSSDCVPPAQVFDDLTCTLPVMTKCSVDYECIYHHCIAGLCAPQCNNGDCPSGTTCLSGSCLLPKGSYCVQGYQCQGPMNTSGTCDGFPRRCQ